MSLSDTIQQEIAKATKARDKERLSTLRLIRSSLQNREIEKRASLTDAECIEVLSSLIKRFQESIEHFQSGNREDLVEKEKTGLQVVLSFLPEQLKEGEIKEQLREIIGEVHAHGLQDLGTVMKTAMPRFKGRADGRLVQKFAREMLSTSS